MNYASIFAKFTKWYYLCSFSYISIKSLHLLNSITTQIMYSMTSSLKEDKTDGKIKKKLCLPEMWGRREAGACRVYTSGAADD